MGASPAVLEVDCSSSNLDNNKKDSLRERQVLDLNEAQNQPFDNFNIAIDPVYVFPSYPF